MSFVDKLLPKDKPSEYFLILKVGIESLQAVVWEVKGNSILILGRGETALSTDRNYIAAADAVISQAEAGLPEGKVVEKVIFGLPFEFIHNSKIKPEILTQLKKLTHTLSLTPIGFIELPEALAHYLKGKDNSPSSALLVGINVQTITVSLLRVGQIQETVSVPRGEYFSQDVEKGVKSLTMSEVLPSRILLYDENEDLERLQEDLVKHPWHNKAAFLHFPKIETVKKDDLSNSLVQAAASEILKTESNDDLKSEYVKDTADTLAVESVEEKIAEHNKETADVNENKETDEAELLGFHKNKDVLEIEEEVAESKEYDSNVPEKKYDEIEDQTLPDTQTQESNKPKFQMPHAALPSFKLPSFSLPIVKAGKMLPVIVLVIIFLILAGALGYAYYALPTANIRILVGAQNMQKDLDITLSPNATSVDKDALVIPASTVNTESSGDKSAATTGKKNVGNPAKGSVTIYNKTSGSKSFPSGTVLSTNNIKFTLDSNVNVASASDTGEGLTYGKTDAKTTASNIGPEGNISGGNTFTVDDQSSSSVTAKNNDAFGGGTSRQVSVVSKTDQDKLLEDLSSELKNKAKSDLAQKVGNNEKILEDSLTVSMIDKKFNPTIDTEASKLSLSLTAKIEALVYKTDDLNALVRDTLSSNVPSDFEFSENNTNLKVNTIKAQKDGTYKASTVVTAYLLPKLPLSQIQKDLAGKNLSKAQDYIRNEKNVMGVEITIDTPLPFGKSVLPLNSGRIHLSIASQR